MTDAIVIGGGLAGLAAAVAVAASGLDTIHVSPKGPPDRRTSALMNPSIDYLRGAGLLADPAAIGNPLTSIRIIDATDRLLRAPETLFDASEAGAPAFGWNLPNIALGETFAVAARGLPNLKAVELPASAVARTGQGWRVTLADGTELDAPFLVGSDGKRSMVRTAAGIGVRERDFAEAALVCDLSLGRPLGGTSVEFHYPHGPFTLVPAGGNRANLVWIDERPVLDAARAAEPEAFRALLAGKMQRLFGEVTVLGPAQVFPLSTLTVETAGSDGVVLAGEAAHAFPPIGAQGLNLGLRDVADLSRALADVGTRGDGWASRVSARYAALRADDLRLTGTMVDALFRSLLMGMLPAQALRAGGLWALRLAPPLRRSAFALGMGAR